MEKARIVSSYLDVYPDVLEGIMLRLTQHKSLRRQHPRSEGTCLHQEFTLSLSKGTQAEAVCELFGGKKEDIKVIGIRHGEKMYETLLTNEECARAEDMGDFYRVPADNRGLNYDKFFKEGEAERNTLTEFNSDNTRRLNLEETKAKITSLEYIQKELAGVGNFVQ